MKQMLLLPLGLGLVALAWSQASPENSPQPHEQQAEHAHGVEERGDQGMGFRHDLTGHHFHLLSDGGAIAVAANDPNDAASRDAIRAHLTTIVGMFRDGNFSIPMFVHATVPPGVATMRELRKEINYVAEPTKDGAQITIRTSNPKALAAIHEFLRFQITDHRTGDPVEVRK
jgi:hypothetical protein